MIYNALPRTLRPGYNFGPHCHKNLEVCLMTDGACDIVVNGEAITVHTGKMMVIFQHMIHSFHVRTSSPCSFFQIHFQPDSFSCVEPKVTEEVKFLRYMADERSSFVSAWNAFVRKWAQKRKRYFPCLCLKFISMR